MKYIPSWAAAFFAFAIVGLSACGANNSMGVAPASQNAAAGQPAADTATRNVSGQYLGTVKDGSFGKGTAAASFAQSGATVGGSLALTFGSTAIASSLAASLAGHALQGRTVAMVSSVACGFQFTGKYDPATHRLSGTYQASNGCSSEKGTFSMKEQCYYARDWDVRPDAPGLKPC